MPKKKPKPNVIDLTDEKNDNWLQSMRGKPPVKGPKKVIRITLQ